MTSRNAAARPLIRWARSLGCEVERARSGHYKVKLDGRLVAVMASTPSDHRSMKNAKAQIRRGVRRIKKEY